MMCNAIHEHRRILMIMSRNDLTRDKPEIPVNPEKVQRKQREIQEDPTSRKTPEVENPIPRETPEVPKIPPKTRS
jgi:hypothetical protein